MELDDLKKTWSALDKQLQDKELVTDQDLELVMKQKRENAKGGINAILRSSKNILALSLVMIAFIVFVRWYDGVFLSEAYFWALVAIFPIAIGWSIFTMHYLRQTNIEEMPLTTVIERINKYNYWMSIDRISGTVILFAFVLISAFSLNVGEGTVINPTVFATIWIVAFIFYFWFINKYTFKRLKDIRKNLNELKEL
ncbi:hypothetical protein D0T50_03295 [Bacteroides sp. 214]|uniref:hypothetical protein n=1 Tax=Bacteroides sp. 214 TaxID=2302935 RepID=UPI0013D2D21A|nr:hypothetical protein [Bacteroides sp. 214]NDW11914.1 hypothetical protein [Bacteroides sp. 214]